MSPEQELRELLSWMKGMFKDINQRLDTIEQRQNMLRKILLKPGTILAIKHSLGASLIDSKEAETEEVNITIPSLREESLPVLSTLKTVPPSFPSLEDLRESTVAVETNDIFANLMPDKFKPDPLLQISIYGDVRRQLSGIDTEKLSLVNEFFIAIKQTRKSGRVSRNIELSYAKFISQISNGVFPYQDNMISFDLRLFDGVIKEMIRYIEMGKHNINYLHAVATTFVKKADNSGGEQGVATEDKFDFTNNLFQGSKL